MKVNRFIQFNDEAVETHSLLLYERLARALTHTPYIQVTERKLMEMVPREGVLSISVFWRHREELVIHYGRLSDLYVLTLGFWSQFSIPEWRLIKSSYQNHPLEQLASELLLLLEERRLVDHIQHVRPGTKRAFNVRIQHYVQAHRDWLMINGQKRMKADVLFNVIYLWLFDHMLQEEDRIRDVVNPTKLQLIIQETFDATSTKDNRRLVQSIITLIEASLQQDLSNQYYTLTEALIANPEPFEYHDGVVNPAEGEASEKETIEEVFRTWHRENANESGVHLQYELEHGRSGRSTSGEATPGNEQATALEQGRGMSQGNEEAQWVSGEADEKNSSSAMQKAGNRFGKEHVHVVYEAFRIHVKTNQRAEQQLLQWREEQKPFVRALVTEIKKRIELKQDTARFGLMKGRLSSNLLPFFLEERPRLFYRKVAPSIQLNAVFGLLVDGSESMLDKLEDSKKAVLLFHDVLRQLQVQHEISTYYEDAYNASKERQPNYFGMMHTFHDQYKDNGKVILSFDVHEDNRDGFAIRWMAERLQARPEKHKFLLLFSDGEPSAYGYDRNGILDTAEAVLETEKKGISVIHLLLSSEEASEEQKQLFQSMFGHKSVAAHSVENFTEQTLRILRKLLALVITTG